MSEAGAAASATAQGEPIIIGRYAVFDELASGGMATVHLGRLLGPVGFGRTVAVKRLHEHYLKDEEFIAMFMDEARIVARIRHPNVVPMVDVVQSDKGLFLIMEYVHGETLSRLMRSCRQAKEQIPPKIATALLYGVLLGLHGAHETKGADGKLLGVVHRDVSPQNVMVGADGVPRVLDFGIAKAAGRAQVTREGQIKGKLAYMAPEQIRGQVDRRTDVFAASVVLWEALAGRRLHEGSKDVDIVTRVIKGNFPKPSEFAPGIPPELDAIVTKGLAVHPDQRYASARDLALDIERKIGLAPTSDVVAWVERLAPDVLAARSALVSSMEVVAADLIADDEAPPPSLSFPAAHAPPPQSSRQALGATMSVVDTIPIEFEPQGHPVDPTTGTSSVFAHTHSAEPHSLGVAEPPRQNLKPIIAVVAASAFLALVGITLGAYAIVQRSSATTPPPALSQTVVPSGAPSAAPPPATSTTSLAPALSPSATTAASADPPPSATDSAPPSLATASATPTPVVTPITTAATTPTSTPVVAPPATTTKGAPQGPPPAVGATQKPPAKKPAANCDPPYTVDEVGHRKYKTECLGLD